MFCPAYRAFAIRLIKVICVTLIVLSACFDVSVYAECFQINDLDIIGAKSLSKRALEKIKLQYEGQCLDESKINELLRDLTNQYVAKGYITSSATIPEQTLKDGKLIIEVKEAHIEEVQYKSKTKANRDRSHVLPSLQNQTLNLRDIEQAVDQLNRLKSNNAKVQILPGKTPASSVLVIDNEPQKKWYLSTGIDNSGTKYKGIQQSFTTITLEDLLHSNELYSFGTRYSLSDPHSRFMRSYSGVISVPYGYHNITFSSVLSTYRTYILANLERLKNRGGSKVGKLSLDSVIHRDGNSKTMTSIGFGHDNYSNYIADTRIEIASYKIDKLELILSHQRRLDLSVIGGSLSYIYGINKNYMKGFGSFITPNKRFNKINYDLSWMKPLPIKPAYVFPKFSIMLHGQYTPQMLCGSEKISVGGLGSVRGFKELSENSDNGAYIRNELSLGLPNNKSPHSLDLIEDVQLYIAYDVGRFRNFEAKGEVFGSMSGGSLGIRNVEGMIKFDLTFSKAFSSKYIKRNPMEMYFSVALSI